MEDIQKFLHEGYPVVVSKEETSNSFQEKWIKVISLSEKDWSFFQKHFNFSDNIAIVSPTGRVMLTSNDIEFVRKELERFRVCIAATILKATTKTNREQQKTSPSTLKFNADEWVTRNSSAITDNEEGDNFNLNHGIVAVETATTETSMNTLENRKLITKIAVNFNNGTPTQVIELPGTSLFSELIERIPGKPDTLILKYPRKEFSLKEHGSMTLIALELTSNPALLVKSLLRAQQHNRGENNAFSVSRVVSWVWGIIMSLLLFFKNLLGSLGARQQQQQQPQRSNQGIRRDHQGKPDEKKKKSNQYWNGDSTVFEGPDDNS